MTGEELPAGCGESGWCAEFSSVAAAWDEGAVLITGDCPFSDDEGGFEGGCCQELVW